MAAAKATNEKLKYVLVKQLSHFSPKLIEQYQKEQYQLTMRDGISNIVQGW